MLTTSNTCQQPYEGASDFSNIFDPIKIIDKQHPDFQGKVLKMIKAYIRRSKAEPSSVDFDIDAYGRVTIKPISCRRFNLPRKNAYVKHLWSYFFPVMKKVEIKRPVEERPCVINEVKHPLLVKVGPYIDKLRPVDGRVSAVRCYDIRKRADDYVFIEDKDYDEPEGYFTYGNRRSIGIPKCRLKDWIRDLLAEGIEPNPGPGRNTRNQKNKQIKRRRNINRNRNRNVNPRQIQSIDYNNIMPSVKIATLKYLDGSTVRNNPGGSFLVYSMRINDLYDPDPALLSGSVSNFKEMMQFYSYYRVLHTGIQWTVINLETFPLSCGIVFSQINLTGVISSLADCQNAFENDFVVPLRTISAKGGMDKTQFRLNTLSIARLLGVGTQYRSESNYAGNGLATPTTPLWANFIVFAPTGNSLANGYANSTTLYMRSEFFGRLNNRT